MLREAHMSKIDLGSHNPTSNVGQHCKWALGLLVLGLFALQSTASHSQEAIGSATSVKPQAEANTRTLQVALRFIPKNLFTPVTLASRICDFTTTVISVWAQNRASVSISSSTTRINLPAALR
jgi:hypothetical protein